MIEIPLRSKKYHGLVALVDDEDAETYRLCLAAGGVARPSSCTG